MNRFRILLLLLLCVGADYVVLRSLYFCCLFLIFFVSFVIFVIFLSVCLFCNFFLFLFFFHLFLLAFSKLHLDRSLNKECS